MQTVFVVVAFVMGLATLGCFVFGVYSLPMGLLLKDRKQALVGLFCLLGALAGFFIAAIFLAMGIGKMC